MPHFENMPGIKLDIDTESIGREFGLTFSSTQWLQSSAKVDLEYIFKSLEDIDDVNDLFDSNIGRWGNVWFPSWEEDFVLTGDIEGNNTEIDVKATDDYSTYYPAIGKTGRHIFIYVSNSEYYIRRITGYDTDSIFIDFVTGKDIPRSKVKFICFLYSGRFDQDEIEWNFITQTVAKLSLSFAELPHEYTTTSSSTTSTTTSTVSDATTNSTTTCTTTTISTTTSSTSTVSTTSSSSSTVSTTSSTEPGQTTTSSTTTTSTTSSTASSTSTTSSTASTTSTTATSDGSEHVLFDGEGVTFDGDSDVWFTTTTTTTSPP